MQDEYSVREAADILGVTTPTVYRLCKAKGLGRKWHGIFIVSQKELDVLQSRRGKHDRCPEGAENLFDYTGSYKGG